MDISNKEKQENFPNKDLIDISIFAERIRLLYQNLLISVPASFLCAMIVFIALYRVNQTPLLSYWILGMIFVTILRVVLAGLYLHDPKPTKSNLYQFIFIAAISGALWGFTAMLMPANHLVEQMITIVVLSGVAAGGVQSLQASFLTCLIYINLLLLPLCVWIFSQNGTGYSILGVATLLYLLFTTAIAWRGYSFLNQTLRLKYRNIELTEKIFNKNKQLEKANQLLMEKENNLRLIHDNAPIGMAIITLNGKWLNVNTKLCEILGYSKSELETLTINDITYKNDLSIGLEKQTKLLSGKLQSYQIEKRYVHKNGQLIWILINVSLVRDNDNKPFYLISQIQDITDRKQNDAIISDLSKMNEILQLCHDSTEAYSIIARTGKQLFIGLSGGLAIFNQFTRLHDTVGSWGDHPLLAKVFKTSDCWALRTGNVHIVKNLRKDLICQHFESTPEGGYICVPLILQNQIIGLLNFNAEAAYLITHHQRQIIANFSEIVKLSLANINLNEALREQAIHDPLTGIFNRRYLYEYLPQKLDLIIHTKQTLCVCMLDLDFFKQINDQFGHDAGDEVLRYVGTILKENFRENDITCRIGGEEFLVVLIGVDLNQAMSRMEHIRQIVKNAQIYDQEHLLPPITVSIGIAEAPIHGKTIGDLMRVVDSALYAAKEAGRDRVVIAQNAPVMST